MPFLPGNQDRRRKAFRSGAVPLALLLLFLTAPVAAALAQPETSPLDIFEQEMLQIARQSEAWVVNIEAQFAPPAGTRLRILPAIPSSPQRRIGSGIAVDEQGGIITTASIVDGARTLQIRTRQGETHPARIVGIDRRTNIALISAEGAHLVPARLGESELVTPGSRVVVVGSMPPDQPMSSFGTIQVDRGLVWGYSEVEMLQLNAPVIRGSNGAAVVNSEGRVVGMICGMLDDPAGREDRATPGGLAGYIVNNRVVASPVHTVSFAIPIEKAREIAAELKQHGRVDRGFLGVVVQRVEAGTPGQPGVLVREVMPGGPGAAAGIQPGDLILQYAGQSVSIGDQLTFLVSATRPGSRVALRLLRGGRQSEIQAVIGVAPNRYDYAPSSGGVPEAGRVPGDAGNGNQSKRP